MKYINQLEYAHIPYRTFALCEEYTEEQRQRTVAKSGCGPCSVCMMVEMLTTEQLDIAECIRISEACVANHSRGTDLKILGPVIAENFGLSYAQTNDSEVAIAHLQQGGQVVVHVAVPAGKEIGLFTKSGHFMLLTATDGKEFCILDPSYTPEKFKIPERIGKVDESHAPYLYCDVKTLHAETKEGEGVVKYHLFARKR